MDDVERIESLRCVIDDISREACDLREVNEHLVRQVKFLARELEKQGYAFTAEDWMAIAEREAEGGSVE